jgi:hypothetical protein
MFGQSGLRTPHGNSDSGVCSLRGREVITEFQCEPQPIRLC